jgi:cell division septum initiation protein DivIVA
MATEPHRHHPETGEVILEDPGPTPAETEARALEAAAKAEADASIERARIQADADVELAKIEHKDVETITDGELEALRAENETLKTQLAAMNPEPEVIPVPAPDPAPGPEPDPAPPVTDPVPDEPKAPKRRGLGAW